MRQTESDALALFDLLQSVAPDGLHWQDVCNQFGWAYPRLGLARHVLINEILPGTGWTYRRIPGTWEYGLINAGTGHQRGDTTEYLRSLGKHIITRTNSMQAHLGNARSAFQGTRGSRGLQVLERRCDNLGFEAEQFVNSL